MSATRRKQISNACPPRSTCRRTHAQKSGPDFSEPLLHAYAPYKEQIFENWKLHNLPKLFSSLERIIFYAICE
jgi:hypothetical protein